MYHSKNMLLKGQFRPNGGHWDKREAKLEAKIKTEMEATVVLHSKMSAVTVRGDMIEKFDKNKNCWHRSSWDPCFGIFRISWSTCPLGTVLRGLSENKTYIFSYVAKLTTSIDMLCCKLKVWISYWKVNIDQIEVTEIKERSKWRMKFFWRLPPPKINFFSGTQ